MAITVAGTASIVGHSTGTHTMADGTNRVIVFTVAMGTGTGIPMTGLSWGGVACTAAANSQASYRYAAIYYMTEETAVANDLDTGAHGFAVSGPTPATDDCEIGMVTLAGVDQDNPLVDADVYSEDDGSVSTLPLPSISTTADGRFIAVTCSFDVRTFSWDGSPTEIYDTDGGGTNQSFNTAAIHEATSGASITRTATLSSADTRACIAGAAFRAAAATAIINKFAGPFGGPFHKLV